MSDQRTRTPVVKPLLTRSAHRLSDGAGHAADLARRDRQGGEVPGIVGIDLRKCATRTRDTRAVALLPLGDLLLCGLLRLPDTEHVETQRAQRGVDVVADGESRQRVPAVVAGQAGYRGEKSVGAEVVHQREVGVGDFGGITLGDVGDVDDVEQAVEVETAGDAVREVLRCAGGGELGGLFGDDRAVVAA